MMHIVGGVLNGFVMHSSRGGPRGLRERLLEAAAADVVEVVIPALLYRLYPRVNAAVAYRLGRSAWRRCRRRRLIGSIEVR